jgi:hypothetical protein
MRESLLLVLCFVSNALLVCSKRKRKEKSVFHVEKEKYRIHNKQLVKIHGGHYKKTVRKENTLIQQILILLCGAACNVRTVPIVGNSKNEQLCIGVMWWHYKDFGACLGATPIGVKRQ